MPENPVDLLKLQTDLLNRLVTMEENRQKQIDEMLENQEDQVIALAHISRAANLYFWLTIIGLVFSAIVLIFNISLVLSFLRILPAFR